MNSHFSFRRATVDDAKVLVEQRIEFLKEYIPDASAEEEAKLRRSLDEYYQEAILSGQCVYWLAESNGQPVGGAGMALRKYAPHYILNNGLTAYIFNVFTFPDFRGQGIARELMNRLLDEARRLEIHRVELHATVSGRPLYETLGFVPPKDIALQWVDHFPTS